MSIQDDIFDVADALKRKPDVKKQFERVVEYLGRLETRLDNPPQQAEYAESNFYDMLAPPDLMHVAIEGRLSRGWEILQMVQWHGGGGTSHWKVIFVRAKR